MTDLITIFDAVCAFVISNTGTLTTGLVTNLTYDTLKKSLDFSSLKKRIARFFDEEKDVDKYLEDLCQKPSNNTAKPYRDVEDVFENISDRDYNPDLYKEIELWIKQNSDKLIEISKVKQANKKGINIGNQNAGKNIYNIQGDFKPRK